MTSLNYLLNCNGSVADRGAAYLAGTSRSVGRGWPLWPPPTRCVPGMTQTPTFWWQRWKQHARRHRTEGQRQQGKGSFQRWGVRRKHEAEPMYVANSEPAIWRWGRGRAVVTRRGLISGVRNRCEAGRDMGRWCVLPREALLDWCRTL